MLPTEPTPKKTKLTDHTVLIYGPPKIGKSTWCAQAPGALFLATEPGLNSLEVYQEPIASWAELLLACRELAKKEHKFTTVVLDTVDIAYKLCVRHVCAEWNIKHPADLDYGKGFHLCNGEFERVLGKLAMLPTGLVMVSHETVSTIKTPTGDYQKAMPTLPGKASEVIKGMADFILYCNLEQKRDEDGKVTSIHRVVQTQPAQHYEAGDRTGRLPATVPLDYAEFAAAYEAGGVG